MKKILFYIVLALIFFPNIIFAQVAESAAEAVEIDSYLEPLAPSGGMPLMDALQSRKSQRNFSSQEIEPTLFSTLFWAANGYNRVEEGKRTAPSARNAQEIDIYAFTTSGVYFYEPQSHQLKKIEKGDHRKSVCKAPFAAQAPVILVLVANYNKMNKFDPADREFYSTIDCGYVSQNIYLFAASEGLATVAIGQVNRDNVSKLIKLKNGKIIIAQPVGYAE